MSEEIPVQPMYSWETGLVHLKIVGKPLTPHEFSTLKRNNLIYYMEPENEEEIPPGWYISCNYEEIEKLIGRSFNAETKNSIDERRENQKKTEEIYERACRMAKTLALKCPVCHEEMEVLGWNSKGRARISCFRHKYDVVIDVLNEKIITRGFADEKNKEFHLFSGWADAVMDYGSEESAKAHIMKILPPLGFCTICNTELKTPQEILKHLKETHGCD